NLDRPILLMVANLASHKGQETAIQATSVLVKRGYSPILWLVGEEREAGREYAKHLQSLVVDLGLSEFVKFLGFRKDIPKLLHAVDFLLLPSTHEGLPLVVLEAQASKVVVLAAPTAGIPEVVENGHTGFLIEANNPIGYADTIEILLKNNDLENTIVETAYRKIMSNFSLGKYCENILQEYDKLISA
ncbi:MAG: glycosyltransferase family 4 protein, partial [Confluentibacter sp.]|nr:glycosyltransferase family 4 protein [Confluentibacter sp.]